MRVRHTCWAVQDDDGVMEHEPTRHWAELFVESVQPIAGTGHWHLITTRCDGTPLRIEVTATGKPAGFSKGGVFIAKPPAPAPPPTPRRATLSRVEHPQVSLSRGVGRTWVCRCVHCPWETTERTKAAAEIEREQHRHAHRVAKGSAS